MTPSDLQTKMSSYGYPEDPQDPRINKVRRIFANFPGPMRILDIGCANGAVLKPLLKQHEIHGVDISEPLVKLANEAGIKTLRHDLTSGPLPYPDKSFDAILLAEVIEHTVDTDWIMSEVNRVLKPAGQLVLTYPNVRTVVSLIMMLFFDLPPMGAARYRAAHYRDFTLRIIKMVLRNHKFRLDKVIGSDFFFPKIGAFGSALATYLPSWSLTAVVVATKLADSHYSLEEATDSQIY